ILRGATALLFPSIALDAAGYIVLEAMALGVPVIASDLPVLKDLILPESTGMLVSAGDAAALAAALGGAMERPSSMHALGTNARDLVRVRHSRDDMCAETARIYRGLVNPPQRQ
ncbi:MAG: glycosyltransferase, partial [Bacteroidetes bacterium]|nr:glycosyltransferase [Bacteroidota bacterium]